MATVFDKEAVFQRRVNGDVVTRLPTALVPARAKLEGRFVVLEPQNASKHAEDLYEAGHTSRESLQIWDYMNYGPWSDIDAYASTLRQQSASLDTVFYAIRSKETGRACGQASFLDIQAQNGVIEIGHIWFAPELQKTRSATEALFLMLSYAMDELGYRRMQWRCNAQNVRSRRAAQRLGFRFEGIFYNHLIFKGKNRDTAWYSILDNEWADVRALIEGWLSDDNFDTNGEARSSLHDIMRKRGESAEVL
ncbi:MAG: GNAT family N-acetyltransferase [Granulosicoccus sp.]|nr:GNAT family N-acetyltransferase [Granulosicoccus sp.]